jgi:hypothetical protein
MSYQSKWEWILWGCRRYSLTHDPVELTSRITLD